MSHPLTVICRWILPPVVALVSLLGCGGGGGENPRSVTIDTVVASASITDGNSQVSTVATELPRPLVVVLLNGVGQSVAGKSVTFVVAAGNGTVFAGAAVSDASGVVRERWTLGTTSGPQRVELRAVDSTGAARVFATFTASATAAAPTTLTRVSGDFQTGVQRQQLPATVKVKVTDQYANPAPGASVTLVASDGGTATPASAITNEQGEIEATWNLGGPTGNQTLTASVSGASPIIFTAFANSSAPRLLILSGDFQSVSQFSFSAAPLSVKVTWPDGRPCAGCEVAFSKGSNGTRTPTAIADAAGVAAIPAGYTRSPFSESAVVGLYFGTLGAQRVAATVSGLGSANFTFNVVPSARMYDGMFACSASNAAAFNMIIAGLGIATYGPYGSRAIGTLTESNGSLVAKAYVFTPNTPFGIDLVGGITIGANQEAHGSGTYSIDLAYSLPPGTWSCTRQT